MLKLFLMTKNEVELIESWIKYHGSIFGLENIYILDGSDDDRVSAIYEKFRPLGLTVHYTSAGLNELAEQLNEMMHSYKGADNFLIKLDTDEFLAYTPYPDAIIAFEQNTAAPRNVRLGGIHERLLAKLVPALPIKMKLRISNFSKFFAKLPVTGQTYKASFTCWSKPKVRAVRDICQEITEFTPLHRTGVKSFFHSASFVSTDLGCHIGSSTDNTGSIETGLSIIHYHSTSVEDSVRRARQVLLSHDYIAEQESSEEQRQRLVRLRAEGHLASFHKIDLYLHYLDAAEQGKEMDPEILNQYHPYFRQTGRPIQLTLVRDTLRAIDRKQLFPS